MNNRRESPFIREVTPDVWDPLKHWRIHAVILRGGDVFPADRNTGDYARMTDWYLEGYFGDAVLHRLPVHRLPFQIGRQCGLDLTVDSGDVSRIHAELFEIDGDLFIKDLASTNGTYLNRKIIRETRMVRHGDVLHVGNVEFRMIAAENRVAPEDATRTMPAFTLLSNKIPTGITEFEKMMKAGRITSVFQAIVDARNHMPYGWEILGRGTQTGLPKKPLDLFWIAESIGQEVTLSERMRDIGLSIVQSELPAGLYFMNTHPSELRDHDRLLASLSQLRQDFNQSKLILEVHEQSVTDLRQMKLLHESLKDLDIGLAYDDFGAGRARLLELVEAPPDFLKFDMAFIRRIDKAPDAKLHMLELLIEIAKNMNILTVAEGASRKQEVIVCQELGFDLVQGFYFGKPAARICLPDLNKRSLIA